ncbi:MAG: hypothetical protein OQJ99_00580 [Rhodospirillales bacterium]|nr:hypothetical protein [Rhodospirillales bacterium]
MMGKIALVAAFFALGASDGRADPPVDENAGKVTLTAEQCRALLDAEGVQVGNDSAAYTPGVDVRGKPVAPADLAGGPGKAIVERIVIDIGVDIAAKYGIGAGGGYTAEAGLGIVTVEPGGKVLLKGRVLDALDRRAVLRECARVVGQ